MIGRLLLASLLAIVVAEALKPVGRRLGWSGPVAFGVSFLAGVAAALLLVSLVFG